MMVMADTAPTTKTDTQELPLTPAEQKIVASVEHARAEKARAKVESFFNVVLSEAHGGILDLQLHTPGSSREDRPVTAEYFIMPTALATAFELPAVKNAPDLSKKTEIVEKEIDKIAKDPKTIKRATEQFKEREKKFPDKTPGNGSIVISEAAEHQLAFLKKTFPEEFKALSNTLQTQMLGEPTGPTALLHALYRANVLRRQ